MTTCICKNCSCTEQEVAAYKEATKPLFGPKSVGEYTLTEVFAHTFYHDQADQLRLLGLAFGWLEGQDVNILSLRFDNSNEGGKYSESLTVFAERG